MKYSICIDSVFRNLQKARKEDSFGNKEFLEAMRTVRDAGFTDIEYWAWWRYDVDAIGSLSRDLGLNIVAICTKMISLVDASVRNKYIEGLIESIEAANKQDCKMLISQTGSFIETLSYEEQYDNMVTGLKQCAPYLEKAGIVLAVEPVNPNFIPGYFLYTAENANKLVQDVNSPNIKFLFDICHLQQVEGNIIKRIKQYLPNIVHLHCAGVPMHGEIDASELNNDFIFQAIDGMGYEGYMGFEYFGTKDDPSIELNRLSKKYLNK